MLIKRFQTEPISIFDKLFDDLFEYNSINSEYRIPLYDVIENKDEFIIDMILAGIKKEDINIDIENKSLTVIAERKGVDDIKFNKKETYYGKFKRVFNLPNDVDSDNIDASLSDGILKIKIPKIIERKQLKGKVEIK